MTFGFRTLWLVGIVLSVGLAGCAPEEIAPRRGRVPYRAFPDTYTLTNGCVVVVVAPQVGRIIGYHRVGEANVLWLDVVPKAETAVTEPDEWINYGGDKVWLAPMDAWPDALGRGWPPDFTTDGDPWTVLRVGERELVMVSGISPAHGARVTRTITLPDDTTTVRIGHHLERVMNDPSPVQIWSVTEVLLPQFGLMDLAPDRPLGVRNPVYGTNWKDMTITVDHALGVVRCDWPDAHSKACVFGRWVAAVYPRTIFAQYAAMDVSADYEDMANCEIYVNPKEGYVELEMLSPTKSLPAGGTMDYTVTWKLLDRPPGAGLEGIVRQIEAQAPKDSDSRIGIDSLPVIR